MPTMSSMEQRANRSTMYKGVAKQKAVWQKVIKRIGRKMNMEEKVYHTMKSVGIANLVFGILILLFGLATGIAVIVNGAKLLARKSDLTF